MHTQSRFNSKDYKKSIINKNSKKNEDKKIQTKKMANDNKIACHCL